MTDAKLIIGLTGSFGSGCTTITNTFIRKTGYWYLSLSDILRGHGPLDAKVTRTQLQDLGDQVRLAKGADFLAREASTIIEGKPDVEKWVVDSFRNPGEVAYFRSRYGRFFLIGVYADYETRWNRVRQDYQDDEKTFRADDERDSGRGQDAGEFLPHGQRVTDCFINADVIISNNTNYARGSKFERDLEQQVGRCLGLIEGTLCDSPTEDETIMAIAYANSQQSTCLKRKVGAVLVDNFGNLISSAYNEVPRHGMSCRDAYGRCYREHLYSSLERGAAELTTDAQLQQAFARLVKNSFRGLEYCRALHAEESAILNVAMFGSSLALRGARLYTTTYPCNLCANKIVQVGIGRVIYLEPYPMKEAREILSSQQVRQLPFQGVTFKGYFRLFGREELCGSAQSAAP